MNKFKALGRVQLFAGLDDDSLKHLVSITQEKNYNKKEVIFHHGDEGSALFILVSGAVKIFLNDDKGKEIILKILYEGDFFGEMSLLDGNFRSAGVMAVDSSKALIIQRDEFIDFIKKNPDIALNMMVLQSRRLRKIDEKIASLAFFDSYGKVARLLLDIAEESGEKVDGNIVINTNLTRQQLASIAGLTRETLTRIMGEFQERGAIEVDGRKIVILNESVLKREVM